MSKDQILSVHKYTKILVPVSSHDMSGDARLLIPFTSGAKIGFINREGKIIVEPKYAMCYGECYDENDLIKVAVDYLYGFSRKNGDVAVYSRPLYGLINAKGETILDTEYFSLGSENNSIFSAQRMDGKYGVIDIYGTEIVQYGKYAWIDIFDRGLARVKYGNSSSLNYEGDQWGIIDETGKEILPVKYDNIWNFYGKKYDTIVIEKDGVRSYVPFSELICMGKTSTIYNLKKK